MYIVDTREKPQAIELILKEFDKQGINYKKHKLDVGDYFNEDKPGLVIDRKQNLNEILSNITQKRFIRELIRAKQNGVHLIILIEHSKDINCIDDISKKWKNQRLEFYKFQLKRKLHLFGEYNEWYLYRECVKKGYKIQRPPISPEILTKSLHTLENNKELYDVEFIFCSKEDTGKVILNLLKN